MSDTPGGGGSDGRTTPGHGDTMLVATEQGLKDIEVAVSKASTAAIGELIAVVQDSYGLLANETPIDKLLSEPNIHEEFEQGGDR